MRRDCEQVWPKYLLGYKTYCRVALTSLTNEISTTGSWDEYIPVSHTPQLYHSYSKDADISFPAPTSTRHLKLCSVNLFLPFFVAKKLRLITPSLYDTSSLDSNVSYPSYETPRNGSSVALRLKSLRMRLSYPLLIWIPNLTVKAIYLHRIEIHWTSWCTNI